MINRTVTSRHSIAVSTSESSDMEVLGLSIEHLRDAMVEIARYVLQFGSSLVYGGDLRQYGFSELLFEIVARYQPVNNDDDGQAGVTNYLAWPVHIQMPFEKIEEAAEELNGSAKLVCLDMNGEPIAMQQRKRLIVKQPTASEWSKGLTAMRRHMLKQTKARIILGGRTDGYQGTMPGIGEEALLSLKAGQPLFVIGGFGGCARDIAESLGLVKQRMLSQHIWNRLEEFETFSGVDLNNGLSAKENATLAITPHIDQAIVLILRGLINVVGKRSNE